MKKISLLLVVLIGISCLILSGCTHEMVSLYIYKMPDKLVYEIGEELDISGLELKNIKTDSALLKISNKNANFSTFDSSTSGKKEITVSYGKFTTSFNVYVANKVANSSEEFINLLENVDDNDIILLKGGEYTFSNPIEINNSNIIIGGEGKDKTKINSYIIIGGYFENENINFVNGTNNVSLIGLSINIESEIKNNIIAFKNVNYNNKLGAINIDTISGLNLIDCAFDGFSYGVLANSIDNALVTNSTFKNLYIGAIKINKSTKNSTFSKNLINSIGSSVVSLDEEGKQEFIFGIYLSFNKEENCGVSVYKNSISKIALKNGELKFFDQISKGNFNSLNYMNNSSAIIIRSSDKNNLQTNGISIFFNSIGSSLNNILYNTNEKDKINSSSVMYMSF